MEVIPSANSTKPLKQKRNSNVIYFLIGLITLLIGTNVFTFLKNNEVKQVLVVKAVEENNEQVTMEEELKTLEGDLGMTNKETVTLNTALETKGIALKANIAQLRTVLKKKKFTKAELLSIGQQIGHIRTMIRQFKTDISGLKAQNHVLERENVKLKTQVTSVHKTSADLEKQHALLSKKVDIGSSLKTADITIDPLKVKSSGKEVAVTRINKVNKIRVTFTIADNELSKEGTHQVYLVLVDPEGDVIAGDSTNSFQTVEGESMDYTSHTVIYYLKATKSYSIEWTKKDDLVAGIYRADLYADGYKMGSTSFTLKKKGLF